MSHGLVAEGAGEMNIKKVLTYSPQEKKVRLVRIGWDRRPKYYFRKRLSINLRPVLFQFQREYDGWFCTILGLQIHMKHDAQGCMPD